MSERSQAKKTEPSIYQRAIDRLRQNDREVDPQMRVLRTEVARWNTYLTDIETMLADNEYNRLQLTDRARIKLLENRDDPTADDTEKKIVKWEIPRGTLGKHRRIRDWLHYYIQLRIWHLAGEEYPKPLEPWVEGKAANEQPGAPPEAMDILDRARKAIR